MGTIAQGPLERKVGSAGFCGLLSSIGVDRARSGVMGDKRIDAGRDWNLGTGSVC